MEKKHWIYLAQMFRQNALLIAAWLGSGLLVAILLWIYQMPAEPAWLYLLISFCLLVIWCSFYLSRLHRVNHLLRADEFNPSLYPADLQACVRKLDELNELMKKSSTQEKKLRTDMQDYFSLWAHQIKLPLATLALQLELDDPDRETLMHEVKRIESCVSLAMTYIRIEGSDYQIGWYSLESIIRPVLRENSGQFIARHISLQTDFEGSKVCTDQKWTSFIVEQILSNALKYTPDHSTIQIRTYASDLVISDEGPGIDECDLPRVFEKGFTGKNGRSHMSASSGLGLFLVRKICDQLSISIILQNRYTPLSDPENPDEKDSTERAVQNTDTDSDSRPVCGLDVILHFPSAVWNAD